MTAPTIAKTTLPAGLPPSVLARILEEGYGAGAWHGPDLETAVAEVTPALAFKRPAAGRHNIAEIALHHAWVLRSVIGRLTGRELGEFLMQGEDWFTLDGKQGPSWAQVVETLAVNQRALAEALANIAAGRSASAIPESERFEVVLGVTCHAVYHAGQIQLLKRLLAG